MTDVFTKRRNLETEVCTQREHHAEMKAKIKVIYLQVKANKAPEAMREGLEQVHPQNLRRNQPYSYHHLGFPGSRTVRE